MKMKGKVIIGVTVLVLSLLVISVLVEGKDSLVMSEWGKILKERSEKGVTDAENVYMKGTSAVITEEDIKQGTEFFLLSGMSEERAKEDAYAVMKAFDSEEEYWKFEFKVYQKDLLIFKYQDSLKKNFREKGETI